MYILNSNFNYSTCRRAELCKWTGRIGAENINLQFPHSYRNR